MSIKTNDIESSEKYSKQSELPSVKHGSSLSPPTQAYQSMKPHHSYTPCLKKRANLYFCSVQVKYEPISIKIGICVLEYTLTKTCKTCALHIKYLNM